MKKTLTAMSLCALLAPIGYAGLTLPDFTDGNTIIGSRVNTAAVAGAVFDANTAYADMSNTLTETNTWYVTQGYIANVDGYSATEGTVTVVAGGPNVRSASGAIKISLSGTELAAGDSALTLSFDVALKSGNNNKNHAFTFSLMSSQGAASAVYNTKTGDNVLDTAATTVALTLTTEVMDALRATGADQELIFMVATDAVTGSNRSVVLSNFSVVYPESASQIPEPATATLSLLALAGLCARRRRK